MILSPYLHASLDMLGIAACEYDARLEAVGWNNTFLQFFPEDDGEIYVGEPYADNLVRFYRCRLSPEEMPDVERYIAEGVARHENQTQPFEFIHNGRRLRASSLRAPDGGRVRLWQWLDAEHRTEAVPELVLPVFEALPFIPDGATILDAADRIVAANDAFRQHYGLPADRPVVGCTLDDIIAWCWRGDSPAGAWRAAIRNGLRYDGAPFEIELPGQRWLRVIARHGTGGIGFFTHADITAAKRQHIELVEAKAALQRANEELARLAGTDALTGLANRRAFMGFLASEALIARPLSLLAIDVDHFKAINDRFGHLVGDACLKMIGSIVAEQASGQRRLVSRIGGEEFGVVLGGASSAEAHRIGHAIRAALARAPWRSLHPALDYATISIGICSAEGPIDEDMLYGCADEQLYAAKRNGRDRIESRPLAGTRRTA